MLGYHLGRYDNYLILLFSRDDNAHLEISTSESQHQHQHPHSNINVVFNQIAFIDFTPAFLVKKSILVL